MGIFSDNTFRLRGRLPDGSVARLSIKWNAQYRSLGLSGRTLSGKYVNSNLMPKQVGMVCQFIRELANMKEECYFECGVDKSNQLDHKIKVGRDGDGVMYLSIAKPGLDEVKFVFGPEKQYHWNQNGQELPMNEVSRRDAVVWAKQLEAQLDLRLKDVQESDFNSRNNGARPNNGYQKRPYGGGQNGGYNNQYQQQPSQQAPAPAADFDSYMMQ